MTERDRTVVAGACGRGGGAAVMGAPDAQLFGDSAILCSTAHSAAWVREARPSLPRLFITERTARTYVSNILGKLGLASRTQAALWAVEHKLADPRG